MTNRFIKLSSLGFLLVILVISSCSSTKKLSTKEALLRFQPKANDVYAMNMDLKMGMEGPQTMDMLMTMKNKLKIGDVEKEGAFYLHNTIAKMTMTMKTPMMNIEYDSDNPDNENEGAKAMHETMSKMLNVPLVTKMSNRGKTLESPDYSKIFGDDPALKGQVDQMNTSLQNAFIIYPENPVKVGDTWTGQVDAGGQMPMKQIFTYTVKEITATTVALNVVGDISLESEMVAGSGKMTGSMQVNRESGFVTTSILNQNITMTAMGMEMKVINDIKVTMVKMNK